MYTQPNNSSVKMEYPSHLTADSLEADNAADWYVAYTQARQENVALANLQQQDFDTYLPLFKTFKKPGKNAAPVLPSKKNGQPDHQADQFITFEPMFPRYVFFRPSRQEQSISTARSTRGINSVLAFGANLAVIQHEVLQSIRFRELQRNQAQTDTISPFQPGSHVRFRDPVYQKLEGLVQSVSAQRVVLLLEILGRQKMIQVHHDQVELA